MYTRDIIDELERAHIVLSGLLQELNHSLDELQMEAHQALKEARESKDYTDCAIFTAQFDSSTGRINAVCICMGDYMDKIETAIENYPRSAQQKPDP